MENLEIGLLLMVVGMATVFAILLIIIYLGKGLILLVNKYAPEEVVVKKKHPVVATVQSTAAIPAGSLSSQETAVIVSAVSMATHGLGKVTKIEKL